MGRMRALATAIGLLAFTVWSVVISVTALLTEEPNVRAGVVALWGVEFALSGVGAALLVTWIALRARDFREPQSTLWIALCGAALALSGVPASAAVEGAPAWTQRVLVAAAFGGLLVGGTALARFSALFPERVAPEVLATAMSKPSRVPIGPSVLIWGLLAIALVGTALSGDFIAVGGIVIAGLSFGWALKRQKGERGPPVSIVRSLQGSRFWPVVGTSAAAVFVVVSLISVSADNGPIRYLAVLAMIWAGYLGGNGPLLAAALTEAGFQLGDATSRRRLLWIRWGFLVSILVFLISGTGFALGALGLTAPWAMSLALGSVPFIPLVLIVSFFVAVFYQGSLDPRLALRKTTVYGVLGTLFVFAFAGLGNVVSEAIESMLGLPGTVGTLLYGGTVAVLLIPVRNRLNRMTERWRFAEDLAGVDRSEAA